MTSVAQRFRGKQATEYKLQTWRGEKSSESFTASQIELQSGVGSLHDNMVKVMDVAEAKESIMMDLDIRSAGMSQETVDDFKRNGQEAVHFMPPKEKRRTTYATLKDLVKAWKQLVSDFDPRTSADRSVACARVSQSGLTSSRPKTLQSARNIKQAYSEADNFYANLRTAIIKYLDDKVPVPMMKQGPPASTTNMVQTLSTGDQGEQGEDEEMNNEVTQDEMFAMV